MNPRLALLLLPLALFLARPALAEEGQLPKVGIGFDLFDLTLQPSMVMLWSEEDTWGLNSERFLTKSLYLPLNLSPRFRLEPMLGITKVDDDGMMSATMGAFNLYQPESFFVSYQGGRFGTSMTLGEHKIVYPCLLGVLGVELIALSRMGFGFEGGLGFKHTWEEARAVYTDVRMVMRLYIK